MPNITHAGLLILALDTRRLLLLQRAITPGDPASGRWECPGGKVEPGESPLEAAKREWQEEVGARLPGSLNVRTDWQSGIYQGFVATVPSESDVKINKPKGSRYLNPDDPDQDHVEVVAWWQQRDMLDNVAIRRELREVMRSKVRWSIRLASVQARREVAKQSGLDPLVKAFDDQMSKIRVQRIMRGELDPDRLIPTNRIRADMFSHGGQLMGRGLDILLGHGRTGGRLAPAGQQVGNALGFLLGHVNQRDPEVAIRLLLQRGVVPPSMRPVSMSLKRSAHPDLPMLLRAKRYSDRQKYEAKQRILRRLMQRSPENWIVDDPTSPYPGVTHVPTGFRLHTDPGTVDLLVRSTPPIV